MLHEAVTEEEFGADDAHLGAFEISEHLGDEVRGDDLGVVVQEQQPGYQLRAARHG